MNNERKVFISYSSKDVEYARKLSLYLEERGIKTWYAYKDLSPSDIYSVVIKNVIKECRAFILLFDKAADESKHIIRELGLADESDKKYFWIKIEDYEPDNLSYYLSSTQSFLWLKGSDVNVLSKFVPIIEGLDENKSNEEKCPLCGGKIKEGEKNWYCVNKECNFTIWKNSSFHPNHEITKEEIKKLLNGEKIPMKIWSKKKEKEYDGEVYLVKEKMDNSSKYLRIAFDK